MKRDKRILVAFLLNFFFSVFELIGGMMTGSVAITSDAIHDAGDAVSIGVSVLLEKKSQKQPDSTHTYGYMRYCVLGGFITTVFLTVGSILVIFRSVNRLFNPEDIDYDKMIAFAVAGVLMNSLAAFFTRDGDSINEKAVNLHMLEDVLGWIVVLVGGIVIKFTGFALLDPVMSLGVSVFILFNAVKNLKEILDIFLLKTPDCVSVDELTEHICEIEGVLNVHHIHLWSLDGYRLYATMHVVSDENPQQIKTKVRQELKHHGISHVTIELENRSEECEMKKCSVDFSYSLSHSHHHH